MRCLLDEYERDHKEKDPARYRWSLGSDRMGGWLQKEWKRSRRCFELQCRFRSLQGLGTVPAWWASDYRAFRVERCGWLTRLRPGINLELSGLQDRRALLMGTLAKNYDEDSKDETLYSVILDRIWRCCLSDVEPTSGGPDHCLNRTRSGQASR